MGYPYMTNAVVQRLVDDLKAKWDLKQNMNATSGSISNLNILGNYGIGNVENGGRVYITGWQHKYYNSNFPEIAIARYDAENDAYYRDISMNTAGFVINNLDFDYYGNHGQGSVQTLDVHIGSSDFSIKEGIGNTDIVRITNTGNIDVNASLVNFGSDNWVFAYAANGFYFGCDDDFEINAVGVKIASDGITKSRALYVDSNGYLVSSDVTNTELGYLSGVTSAIQTQLNGKQASITGGATTIVSSNLTASRALISNSSGKVAVSAVTSTELGYLADVTGKIQDQLDEKAASSHTHNYAGSSSAGGAATSANKINTDAGSATQPVYFSNGKPVATTYSLGKSVPSNAVFTDNNTTYTIATGDSNGQIKVTPSTGSAYNVGVKGLGSAAYLTADTAATANTVAKRQGNGYLYAAYFNTTAVSENPASYTAYPAFIDSNGWLRKSSIANMKTALGINGKVNNGWTELLAFGSYTSGSKTLSANITNYAGGIMVARCGASGSSGGSVCGFWPISTGIYSYTSDYFEVSWIEGTNTMKRLTFHFTAANKITIDASINSAALRAIYVLA